MTDSQDGGRRGALRAAAAAVALLVVAVVALVLGFGGCSGPPQPPVGLAAEAPSAARSAPAPATPEARTRRLPGARARPGADSRGPHVGPFYPASRPTALEIPSLGIRSHDLVDLVVAEDGSLEVPGTADEVGFYGDGPTPGQLGPAVLAAHVDSTKGPGVFYRLGAIKPRARINVTRQDGTVATFVVDRAAVYPKTGFPTEQVYYGDFTQSELRLITCGGRFDPVRHYLGNVVVFAHLSAVR